MKALRRLSVVILVMVLGYQAPSFVLACSSGVAQCSTNYGATETNIGAGGPNNSSTSAHSTAYYDGGANIGDIAVGTSQSGSTNNTAGGDRLADDFENSGTLSGWTASADGGAGAAGSITESNTIQHSGQYALLKNTNADPSGGYKSLTSSVTRDWRIDAWIYMPNTSSNKTVALGIENASFNGYRFNIDFSTGTNNLAIQKRTGSAPSVTATTLGTAASLALSTNTWYRVIFGSTASGNGLTLTIYDASGAKQLATTSQTDSSVAGSFDRCVVEGGFAYYLDDLNVYSSGSGYRVAAGFNGDTEPGLSILVNTSTVNLGLLSYSNATEGTASFSVRNYTSWGYVVQTLGTPPTANGHTLAVMNGTSTAGTEQFGINMVANNVSGASPASSFGSAPFQNPDNTFSYGLAAGGYGTPNNFKYSSGDVIAQAFKSSGETDYTISYLVNISTNTPAGLYQMSQTLCVTGTY